jgi:hypothetical protein
LGGEDLMEVGGYYEVTEKIDGKPRIIGPLKPGGWPGFLTDDRGFLYFNDRYFMSERSDRDPVRQGPSPKDMVKKN